MGEDSTAGALEEQLSGDPEYQARLAEHKRKNEELTRIATEAERPILVELAELGVLVNDLFDLAREPKLPEPAVRVILKWLEMPMNQRSTVNMLLLMHKAHRPYDGQPLCRLIDRTEDPHIRDMAANTMSETRPTGIADWLRATFRGRDVGDWKYILAKTVARELPRAEALEYLALGLEAQPFLVCEGLTMLPDLATLEVLDRCLAGLKGEKRRVVEKTIKKIRRKVSP